MLNSAIIMHITCSYFSPVVRVIYNYVMSRLLVSTRKGVITLRGQGYGLREVKEEGTVVSVRSLKRVT